jgi:hypothetical protein
MELGKAIIEINNSLSVRFCTAERNEHQSELDYSSKESIISKSQRIREARYPEIKSFGTPFSPKGSRGVCTGPS